MDDLSQGNVVGKIRLHHKFTTLASILFKENLSIIYQLTHAIYDSSQYSVNGKIV